jgi:acetate kinase
LGGVDALVFAGGIGENSPIVRERICEGLGFFEIGIDPDRNARKDGLISAEGARVKVRVIPTDEEIVIAKSAARLLKLGPVGAQ